MEKSIPRNKLSRFLNELGKDKRGWTGYLLMDGSILVIILLTYYSSIDLETHFKAFLLAISGFLNSLDDQIERN